jgi:hypothetical protein
MKTIYATFEKTIGCLLPVSVPDHFDPKGIRQALHRALIHDPELREILEDLDWELESDPISPRYSLTGVIEHYDWLEEPPVYAFPDEAPPPPPDQLSFLESAL